MSKDWQSCMLWLIDLATDNTVPVVCVWRHIHLDGEGKRSHVDTHTPTPHVQTQMKHNSSPPWPCSWGYEGVVGVGESESESSSVEDFTCRLKWSK